MNNNSMIRVGIGDHRFVLMFLGAQWPDQPQFALTERQAADLYAQLGQLLSVDMLNVEPFSSDVIEDEKEPA